MSAPTSPMLGNFVVLNQEVGRGTFGRVYKALHVPTGLMAAAKMILPGHMEKTKVLAEVHLLRRLIHSNIVRFYDHFELADGTDVIFMELVDHCERIEQVQSQGARVGHCDLLDRLQSQGKLQEPEARSYFGQIASAVAFMHSQGVVHLDLKLDNILLGSDGRAKLCDFGLAHEFKRDAATGLPIPERLSVFCGSMSYVAPEVLLCRFRRPSTGAVYDYDAELVDVWSLGVMLFGLMAGFFPFNSAEKSDWRFASVCGSVLKRRSMTRSVYGLYERPCFLSDGAVALIDACLGLKPSERFSMAQILASPWLSGSGGKSLKAQESYCEEQVLRCV